jgi:cholesterol oxidase
MGQTGQLSVPHAQMRSHYHCVVVGSGYGGAITACRLAEAGHEVCVLERGRELHPGQYPDTLSRLARHTQVRMRGRTIGDPRALFDFHVDGDVSVLVGSGLGGTSLINANVSAEPDPRVFEDLRWPEAIRRPGALVPYFAEARDVLRPQRPTSVPRKSRRLLAAAGRPADDPESLAEVNVTFTDATNAAGVHQRACTGCGDCITGCNVGSKNTVLMNYLPMAAQHGAAIFTEVEVRTVLRSGESWRVSYRSRSGGRSPSGGPTRTVTADVVVLAAGTLGSTEILLRSSEAGLELSEKLGCSFSGNGDVVAFSYDEREAVDGIGRGRTAGDAPPGTCISATFTHGDGGDLEREVFVQDAVIPSGFSRIVRPGLALVAKLFGRPHPDRAGPRWSEVLLGWFASPYTGPSARTQTQLVMSMEPDDDRDGRPRPHGRLVLDPHCDRVRVDWPDAGEERPFPRSNRILRGLSLHAGGTFVPNPLWSRKLGRRVLTVHPLGGAVMGEDAAQGVVDHAGRVFAGAAGTDTHPGLWVADGSVVPRPLGVNPLLTIAALAERTSAELLAQLAPDHPAAAVGANA